MIPRFYCPIEEVALLSGQTLDLPEALAHHALRVLRLRNGDELVLFDGTGGEYPAQILDASRKVRVQVGTWRECECEAPLALKLIQALPGGDKMDWVVQKAVELGVTMLQPVHSKRSVVRLAGERADKRVAHWRQVVVAASEQCGRNRLLKVEPILDFAQYLARPPECTELRLLLSPRDGRRLAELPRPQGPVSLLIGPEGGLDSEEEDLARSLGFQAVTLGPRVFRTETAGLAAVAALMTLWGDF